MVEKSFKNGSTVKANFQGEVLNQGKSTALLSCVLVCPRLTISAPSCTSSTFTGV